MINHESKVSATDRQDSRANRKLKQLIYLRSLLGGVLLVGALLVGAFLLALDYDWGWLHGLACWEKVAVGVVAIQVGQVQRVEHGPPCLIHHLVHVLVEDELQERPLLLSCAFQRQLPLLPA